MTHHPDDPQVRALAKVIADPGSVLPRHAFGRGEYETVPSWGARAVLTALDSADSPRTHRCCEHCAGDSIHDVPTDGHTVPCQLCQVSADSLALARLRMLVTDWPDDQVPMVPVSRLRQILEGSA